MTAKRMRMNAIEITHLNKAGVHIGGTLSLIEIMGILYLNKMNISKNDFDNDKRDRCIMSKGHGALAQYLAMYEAGLITHNELFSYKQNDTFLYAHPSMNRKRGIDFSSGSLGQGLSLAVGVSLALQRKNNNDSMIYVILGDGECDEGSVWEAASSASHYGLKNIVVIVDSNKLQYDGPTKDVIMMDNMDDRWKSFGWDVDVIDGHSIEEIETALNKYHNKPLAIIANTVKGKGISFMESNVIWHNNRLTDLQYEQAMKELNDDRL